MMRLSIQQTRGRLFCYPLNNNNFRRGEGGNCSSSIPQPTRTVNIYLIPSNRLLDKSLGVSVTCHLFRRTYFSDESSLPLPPIINIIIILLTVSQLIEIHLLKLILFNDSVRTPNNRHFPIPMSSIDGNPLINSKPSFNRIPFFIAPPEFDSIANGRVQIHSGPQLLFLHIAVSRCIVRLPGPERLDQGLL